MNRLLSRKRFTAWMHTAIIAVCVLGLVAAPAAAEPARGAGVIIDYGDGRTTYIWVPFAEEEISALELLERTDLDLVTLEFGGMGAAICQIDDTGCPAADCRTRLCQTSASAPFWRILRLHDGAWHVTSTGVSGARVKPGDIYALSWSAVEPELPVLTPDELADRAGAPSGGTEVAMRTEGESTTAEPTTFTWSSVGLASGVVVVAAAALVVRARSIRSTPR